MALADIVIPTAKVEYRSWSFEVRGLTFADLGVLLRDHPDEVEVIAEKFMAIPDEESNVSEVEFIGELVTDFIDVVALAIAMSAHELDQIEKIKELPPAVLVDSLNKIWNLTVEEAGGLGKLVGGAKTMMEEAIRALSSARVQITGTTDSAELSAF